MPKRVRAVRVTQAQRYKMLQFMKAHPNLASGRIDSADGSKIRTNLMQHLADILNSDATGATKSPQKWLKSWQDWKSDIKKKALSLNKSARRRGEPSPPRLRQIEKHVLKFIGFESAKDTPAIPDRLKLKEEQELSSSNDDDSSPEVSSLSCDDSSPEVNPSQRKKRKTASNYGEKLLAVMEAQAEATVSNTAHLGRLVESVEKLTDALIKYLGQNEQKIDYKNLEDD